MEWRAQTGGEGETGLKCKCCSHPLKLLEEYLAKGMSLKIIQAHSCRQLFASLQRVPVETLSIHCQQEATVLRRTKEFILS